jgi:hypothetical protein
MGYNLTIGQKINNPIFIAEELDYTFEDIFFIAKTESLSSAPAFGEPTDKMNQRWPSYTSWHSFLFSSGLQDIFLDEDNRLIGGHPGYFNISSLIYEQIKDKYLSFKSKFKGAIPSFKEKDLEIYNKSIDYKGNPVPINYTLARFEWLMFWLEYSMNKYDSVVISNT